MLRVWVMKSRPNAAFAVLIVVLCLSGFSAHAIAQDAAAASPTAVAASQWDYVSLLVPVAAIPLIIIVIFLLVRGRAARQATLAAAQSAPPGTGVGTVTEKEDFDAFISYSSRDKEIADAVCRSLEKDGVRCWIAPRDVVMGAPFEESIMDAIGRAKAFVFVFTANSNGSVHVESELKAAWRRGIPIVPYRAEEVFYNKVLDYYIGSDHWIDASQPPFERHLAELTAVVREKLRTVARSAADDRAATGSAGKDR